MATIYLYRNEPSADGELCTRRDEDGPLGGVLAGVEDARDAIGLGEQRRVHHREAKPGAKSASDQHSIIYSNRKVLIQFSHNSSTEESDHNIAVRRRRIVKLHSAVSC